ncbi:MAG TPA: hypothetical protein VF533_05400 [Solirubrobacteraceae bacterium]|jgi:hypothetical protein
MPRGAAGLAIALLLLLVAPGTGQAAAPSLVAPPDGSAVTVGSTVTFRADLADAGQYESVGFYVSTSPATGTSGVITPDVDSGSTSSGPSYSWSSYEAASTPRTVYWQAFRRACSSSTDACRYEGSAVFSLRVDPKPAPALLQPAPDATVKRGDSVELSASLAEASTYESVTFLASASGATGPDGRIGTDLLTRSTFGAPYEITTSDIAARAGVVFWQASRRECSDNGCVERPSDTRVLHVLPLPAPALISPADAAIVDVPGNLRLKARYEAYFDEPVKLLFATSARRDPDGTLADRLAEASLPDTDGLSESEVLEKSVTLPKAAREPGTVFWQAYRRSCEDEPDCLVTSEVRSFRIRPEAVRLTASARRSDVRITRPTVKVELECSAACLVEGTVSALGGGRRVRALGSRFKKRLEAGGTFTVRRAFPGKDRRILRRLVRRHGKVRVRVDARATDAEGRVDSVRRTVTVRAPYVPPPPPPPTKSCSAMTELYTKIIRIKAQEETCGKAHSVARFWQLSSACIDDECRARGYDCTGEDVESSRYVSDRRVTCIGRGSITFHEVTPSE